MQALPDKPGHKSFTVWGIIIAIVPYVLLELQALDWANLMGEADPIIRILMAMGTGIAAWGLRRKQGEG